MLFICEWIYFFICIMFLQWRVHSLYKINDWIGNQLGNSSTTNSEMSQMSNHKIIQFFHRVCSFQFQFQFLKFKWFGAPKWNSAFLVNFDVKESDRGKNEYIHFGVGRNRSQCLVMYYIAIDLHCFHYWPLSFSNIKKNSAHMQRIETSEKLAMKCCVLQFSVYFMWFVRLQQGNPMSTRLTL